MSQKSKDNSQNQKMPRLKNPNFYIPMIFVVGFIILAILDGIFVYLAVNSQTGLVTENAYEKGLRYNQAIEKAESAEKIEQKVEITQISNLKYKLNYNINIADKSPQVTAQIIRPIGDGKDFEISLNLQTGQLQNQDLIYQAEVDFPEQGNWDILVIYKDENREFRKKQRVFVK
jgi:nitrogen fixation protein FixH